MGKVLPGAFLELQGRLKKALVQPLSNRCIVDRSGHQFQWVSEVVDPESGKIVGFIALDCQPDKDKYFEIWCLPFSEPTMLQGGSP